MKPSHRWESSGSYFLTRIRRAAPAAFAGLLLITGAVPASAHEEEAIHALAVLDEYEPAIDGVDFRVAHVTAPALVASNQTHDPLTIYGLDDEPFVRIESQGVYVNANSPLTYTSVDPARDLPLPDRVDPKARSEWVLVSNEASWSWFDPRLRAEPHHTNGTRWEVRATHGDTEIAARGHFEPFEGHGHFRTVSDGLRPDITGLEVRVLPGLIPVIFLRNSTNREVTVTGRDGEEFLRVGRRGVFANLRSPSYYLGGAQTILPLPAHADPGAAPRWKKVSDVPAWAWLEYRAALTARLEQRSVLGDERQTVLHWQTPMRWGDEPVAIAGHIDWIPPRATGAGATTARPWLFVAVPVIAAALAAMVLRRWKPRRSNAAG